MNEPTRHPRLFIVACPSCGGWAAVGDDLVGRAACCPTCAAAFLVPTPAAACEPNKPVATPEPPWKVASAPPTGGSTQAAVATEPAWEPAPPTLMPVPAGPDDPPLFELPETPFPADEVPTELQFHEPVARVVGHGPHAIELRRLTPEERDRRRRRRNIVMLLAGAAILIAIAVGLGTRARGRPRGSSPPMPGGVTAGRAG